MKVQSFKMRVTPSQSEIVQKRLFELGLAEYDEDEDVTYNKLDPYLYTEGVGYCSDSDTFEHSGHQELTFQEFQSLYMETPDLKISTTCGATHVKLMKGDKTLDEAIGEYKSGKPFGIKEEWKPEHLEDVCASNDYGFSLPADAIFLCMDGNLFVCKEGSDISGFEYMTYRHCRPVPKKPVLTHAELVQLAGFDFEYKEK